MCIAFGECCTQNRFRAWKVIGSFEKQAPGEILKYV